MMQNTKISPIYDSIKRYNERKQFENAILDYYYKNKNHQSIVLLENGDFFYIDYSNRNKPFNRKDGNYIGSIYDDKINFATAKFVYDYNYMSNYDWAIKFKQHVSRWIDEIRIKQSNNTDSVYLTFKLPQNQKQYTVRFSDHSDKRFIADFNFANPLGANLNGKNWVDLVNWFDFLLNNNIVTLGQPYLYHATYAPLIESIKRNGIDSSLSQFNWIDSKVGVNYLSRDPFIAFNYAKASSTVPESYLREIVILTISSSKLDKMKLFSATNTTCFDDDSTIECRNVVPYDSILKIEKY